MMSLRLLSPVGADSLGRQGRVPLIGATIINTLKYIQECV